MTRTAPDYIPARALEAMSMIHKWDDWDPYPLLPPNDPETEELLGRVSNFAKLVFSIGCAEWVIARFGDHLRNSVPWQFVDACWAYELSEQFALPDELDDSEWEGSILGPVCLALTTILNTRYGFDEDNAEVDAAFAEKVALFVMPDQTVFKQWRDSVLVRLLKLAPVDAQAPPGLRLPRDVLDSRVAIDVSLLDVLRKASVEALDLVDNPFVVAVDEPQGK